MGKRPRCAAWFAGAPLLRVLRVLCCFRVRMRDVSAARGGSRARVRVCVRQLLPEGSLAHQILAWFFVAWWLATTGAGTFSAPFTTTGNGYFAAWGGFLFSVVFLTMTSPLFKQQTDRLKSALVSASFGDQIGLIVCSILCLVDASVQLSFGASILGYTAYAISVACVSIVLTAVTIFLVTGSGNNPGYVRAFAWIAAFL